MNVVVLGGCGDMGSFTPRDLKFEISCPKTNRTTHGSRSWQLIR
jgi:hypothetical protein